MRKSAVLSLICAMAVSAVSFSAHAEETTAASTLQMPFEVQAEFDLPAIDVTFPTSISAMINPYHLNIEKDGWRTGNSGVTSPEYEIANNSDQIGIRVNAKLSAVGSGEVRVVSVDTVTGAAPTFRNDGTEDKQVFAFLNTTLTKGIYSNSSYTGSDDSQLAFSETAPEEFAPLMSIGTASSGFFRIQGDVVEEPAAKWHSGDSVTFNIVFDVSPYNPKNGSGQAY